MVKWFIRITIVFGKSSSNRTQLLEDLPKIHEQREIFIFIIDRETPFRGDEFINEHQWLQVRELYLSQAKTNKWTVIKNDSSLENCAQEIIAHLQF